MDLLSSILAFSDKSDHQSLTTSAKFVIKGQDNGMANSSAPKSRAKRHAEFASVVESEESVNQTFSSIHLTNFNSSGLYSSSGQPYHGELPKIQDCGSRGQMGTCGIVPLPCEFSFGYCSIISISSHAQVAVGILVVAVSLWFGCRYLLRKMRASANNSNGRSCRSETVLWVRQPQNAATVIQQ